MNAIVSAIVAGSSPAPVAWTPRQNTGLAEWLDSTSVADGTVATIASKDATSIALAATGTINKTSAGFALTGTQYFSRSAPVAVAQNKMRWPDGNTANVTAGKGITCTGLTKLADGTYISTNHGWARPGDVGSIASTPSLLHASLNRTTWALTLLDELALQPLYGNTLTSVQCLGVDSRTGYRWWSDEANNKIRVTSSAGAVQTALEFGTPTNAAAPGGPAPYIPGAVTLDISRNRMWVSERYDTSNVSLNIWAQSMVDGTTLVAPAAVGVNFQDSLTYHAGTDMLGLTYGNNGSAGALKWFYAGGSALRTYGTLQLPTDTLAIEGADWDGATELMVSGDPWYHLDDANGNRMVQYVVAPLFSRQIECAFDLYFPSGVPATKAVFMRGDAISSAGIGHGFTLTNTTTLVFWAGSGGTGTTTQAKYTFTIPDVSAGPVCIAFQADRTANTVTLQANGTTITPTVNVALSVMDGPFSNLGGLRVGNTSDTNRLPTWTFKQFVHAMGLSDINKLAGWINWVTGNQSLLPGGHPYKAAAPTA